MTVDLDAPVWRDVLIEQLGLAASAANVPRAPDGKWCKGAQCQAKAPHPPEYHDWGPGQKAAWAKGQNVKAYQGSSPAGTASRLEFDSDSAAEAAWEDRFTSHQHRAYEDVMSNSDYDDIHTLFTSSLTTNQAVTLAGYQNVDYKAVNRHHKYGEMAPGWDQADMDLFTERMDSTFEFAVPMPDVLRGKSKGPMADMDYVPGTVFTEPGYGSWTTHRFIASDFANHSLSKSQKHVVYRMRAGSGVRGVPGSRGEMEFIAPRGTSYRVTLVEDYVGPTHTYRYMEVEPA